MGLDGALNSDRLGRMGQGLSPLVHFKRPVGDARGVVKVCARRKRGARVRYVSKHRRVFGKRAIVGER